MSRLFVIWSRDDVTVTSCLHTNEHDSIYDFLTGIGYTHEEAADIASWAELASEGEEYYGERGDAIWIAEEDAE